MGIKDKILSFLNGSELHKREEYDIRKRYGKKQKLSNKPEGTKEQVLEDIFDETNNKVEKTEVLENENKNNSVLNKLNGSDSVKVIIEESEARIKDNTRKEVEDKTEVLCSKLDSSLKGITEAIHKENVKTFRNIEATIDDLSKKVAKEERLEKEVSNMKIYLKCVTIVALLNFIVLVAYILFTVGVF